MNLRKSILALSVVAGIVAAPMTVLPLILIVGVLPSTMDMKMKCLVYMMTGINVRHVMYIITNNV